VERHTPIPALIFNLKFKKMKTTKESQKEWLSAKEVLTSDETALYMGISKSYLYKLTMRHQIPHYKPMGKMCYFNRVEVENWLQTNRVATSEEYNEKANDYMMKGGKL
jgi:excisionase family DNA binding protein